MLNRLFQMAGGSSESETDVASVVKALEGDVTVLDVREPQEWQSGHIAGAIHIPLGDLARRAGEVDASKPVVTVCRSGRRSLEAVRILRQAGLSDVKSMAGGMIAWQEAKQPIVR